MSSPASGGGRTGRTRPLRQGHSLDGAGLISGEGQHAPPPGAFAAALAGLPGAGPAWLAGMLSRGSPEEAWELVVSARAPLARAPDLPRVRHGKSGGSARERLSEAALAIDVGALWLYCQKRDIKVTWLGGPAYPEVLASGPAPPGVLFFAGDLGWVERCPVVAVVGTRRCSPEGASTAYQLAKGLAAAGVCVVSGLALGIDGAAHAGAIAGFEETGPQVGAATIGVAASGVDVIYPRQHAALWRQVVRAGAVVSETPPGLPAQSWRFPARNRVIAGLSRMVVVVESHVTGGSWHTVDAALKRGTEVGAVPGSVHSAASAGTNALLRDGATPVRGAQDVLDAIGLLAAPVSGVGSRVPRHEAKAPGAKAPEAKGHDPSAGTDLAPLAERVLAALGWRPLCLEELVERAGLPVGAAVVALDRLEASGAVVSSEDGWWRRRA